MKMFWVVLLIAVAAGCIERASVVRVAPFVDVELTKGDMDDDGILDSEDACPRSPEDRDGARRQSEMR